MTDSASSLAFGLPEAVAPDADLERRFGGLRRLYGDAAYGRIRAGRFAVVGVGGVGSWTAEALARSGAGAIALIDLDQVSESNINRQVQALGTTVGQAKVDALKARLLDIHPGCEIAAVEAFAEADNWPALLPAGAPYDVIVDACDQGRAKTVLAAWALVTQTPLVVVGAAGGKRQAQAVAVEDLGLVSHDPMLAALRQRLRKLHGAPRHGPIGLACVYSQERVQTPMGVCDIDGSLNCHGYGSSVAVTATFGMVAASVAIELVLRASGRPGNPRLI